MRPAGRLGLLLPTFFLLTTLSLLLGLAACVDANDEALTGTVSWVYDGDTLEVAGAGKVRLLGIDTPEREDSDRDRFYRRWNIPPTRLRAISREALSFNIRMLKGKTVRLEFEGRRRDTHGRLLAYVRLSDGRLLNRLLLEQGYATAYRKYDFSRKREFLKVEEAARNKKSGLWKEGQ